MLLCSSKAVAISLYEEGAVTLIYVVLVNCKFMLERSSKTCGKVANHLIPVTDDEIFTVIKNIMEYLFCNAIEN